MTKPSPLPVPVARATCILALAALSLPASGQMPPFRKLLSPMGIIVDAVADRISWVEPLGSVEIVDAATRKHRGVPIISPQFAGLDASTGYLYVPSVAERSTLIVIDTVNGAITAVVPLAAKSATRALVDAQARKVYVLQQELVAVVDADSHAVEYIELADPAYEAVLDSRNRRLYAVTGKALVAIDTVSRAATAIPIPAPSPVIALNAVTNEVLLLADAARSLAIVDGTTYRVTTIPVPGVANRAMAVDSSTGKVYIPNPPASTLTVVDPATQQIVNVPVQGMPNRIAINEATGRIYMGLLYGGVLVMDRTTLDYFTIPVGSNPGEVTVDTGRDLAYFGDTHSVLVVDGRFATATSAAAYDMAVEFHHPYLDHYVVTTSKSEIDRLQIFTPWVRTGATFGTFVSPDGTTPMCRFYLPPSEGDSHLMMASPAECAATAAKFPAYVYESRDVFRVALPDPLTGACSSGLLPMYRLWNQRRDSNHRYVVDIATRNAMVAEGWVAEGFGPDAVAICVPRPATYTLP
jgi:DNA-binding beta-propeller fold protein YncE